MARDFGRIRISIADDHDFEQLSPAAQWLYCRIAIPDPSVNHCGVFDWRPARLLRKARGLSRKYLEEAAGELEAGRFLLFDLDTEEALMRAYLRAEQLLRNPKYGAAVVNSYRAIASSQLRAAVADEVRRVRSEHPEYSSWKYGELGPQLEQICSRPTLLEVGYAPSYSVPKGNDIPVQIGNLESVPITDAEPVQIGDPVTNAEPVQIGNRNRSGFIEHEPIDRASTGGQVSGVPHQEPEPEPPPPPNRFCEKHPEGTTDPCTACQAARKRRADFDAAAAQQRDHAEAARRAELQSQRDSAAAAEAQAIVNCGRCDDDGYRGTTVCDHREHSTPEGRANAMAVARAAMAKGGDDQ